MNTRQRKVDPNPQKNIFFLQQVYERRNTLFGKKSNFGLSNGGLSKDKEWEQVRLECIANGMSELSDKPWKHLRDVTWQNIRRRALGKLDQIRSKSKDVEELTDSDQLALAIINNVVLTPQLQFPPDYENEEVIEPTPTADRSPTPESSPQQTQQSATEMTPHLTASELRRIKMEPREDGHSADQPTAAISALLFENTHGNGTDGYSTMDANSASLTQRPLFEDEEVNVETVETTEPPINERAGEPNNAGVQEAMAPASRTDEEHRRHGLKRKRELAEIRHLDAETEKLLAEAQLIKMQAAEIHARLQFRPNGQTAGGLDSNVEVNVVDDFDH